MLLRFHFRLLGEVDAFDLGHTFDPKTFGIWMGTKILVGKDKNGKEMAILLLDTEGIGKEVFLRLNCLNLPQIDHPLVQNCSHFRYPAMVISYLSMEQAYN